MTEPFEYLEYPRKDRARHLQKLIGDIISRDMVFLIVKTKGQLFEEMKYDSLRLAKGRGFTIYGVKNNEQIAKGVNLLVKIRLWHKPIFHILVGYQDLARKLIEKCHLEEDNKLDSIEKDLESDIIGFLDPVDDVLECYGKEPFRTIISQQSST